MERKGFLNKSKTNLEIQEWVICHCERSEAIQSKLSGLPRRAKICPPRNDCFLLAFVTKCLQFETNLAIISKRKTLYLYNTIPIVLRSVTRRRIGMQNTILYSLPSSRTSRSTCVAPQYQLCGVLFC